MPYWLSSGIPEKILKPLWKVPEAKRRIILINQSAAATNNQPITAPQITSVTEDAHVKASPLAKSIAKKKVSILHLLQASGDQGRIVKRDIEAALQNKSAAPVAKVVTAPR